ncbi:MAG: hypothetical protein Q9219_007364, partial [cf. Caloplaca sp. 3 TL-2023]
NALSTGPTAGRAHFAVASEKGDIRRFNKLGLGDLIIGLVVSADGHWILAICRTSILLIDALQKDGKNKGCEHDRHDLYTC